MSEDLRAACAPNPRRFHIWIVRQKIHRLKKNNFLRGACALKRNNTLIFYGENIALSSKCAKHDHTSFIVHGREEYNSNPGKWGKGKPPV